MNGAEHYEYAEHLLELAGWLNIGGARKDEPTTLAAAQAHATLALAWANNVDALAKRPHRPLNDSAWPKGTRTAT